jgi:NADH-quinone oxidoreductase subunit B
MIALQKKIDGQSLANMDDVPWYGVGPAEPTPVPVLGPDIIDPRQMDMIRRQAAQAALGQPIAIRELPERVEAKVAVKKVAAKTEASADGGDADPEKAARMRKREEAMARLAARRAAKG